MSRLTAPAPVEPHVAEQPYGPAHHELDFQLCSTAPQWPDHYRRALTVIRGLVTSYPSDEDAPGEGASPAERARWIERARGAEGDSTPARICRRLAEAVDGGVADHELRDLLLFARAYLERDAWGTWRSIYATAVLTNGDGTRFAAREGLWRKPDDPHHDIAEAFARALGKLPAHWRKAALAVVEAEHPAWCEAIAKATRSTYRMAAAGHGSRRLLPPSRRQAGGT